MIHTYSAE